MEDACNFIKKNCVAKLLFTDTVSLTYEIFWWSFLNGKICLTLAVIQMIQSFLMRLIEKLLAK